MRRKIITVSVMVGILIGIVGTFGSAPAKVYIDIDAPGFRKFPVAVPDFIAVSAKDPAAADEARKALLSDLFMAGIFDVVSPARYTPNPDPGTDISRTNYAVWKKVGADAVIKTTYEISGNNIAVEIRLVDVANERLVFGRKYKAGKNDFSRVIHKFADDLMYEYTGEKGIFQTMITFVTDLHGKKEIYIMDLDGNNKVRLTSNRVIDLSPSWSPDATKIVYCSFKQRAPKIFMMNIKTHSDRLVAGFEGINIGADFSPAGGGIAFTSSKDYYPNLYTISEGGTGLKRLTNGPDIDVSPSFSPDGSMIAFTSDRGGSPQIYVMNPAGGAAKRITYSGGYNTSPDWSPRGDKIAYVGMTGGMFHIYVVNKDGTGTTRLTSGTYDNEDPSWSPDGRFVVFSSTRSGRSQLYWMRADGTDQTRIPATGGNDTSPDWSGRVIF
ncbi:MAG: Tol-Pal system beta propeller repeat protein TolB [Deltaproteobacteria bacterium]|nr:Tol-Pal system beta propeller repeat protein TolB [Candidatus Zymogenaceae bacterium]